MFGRAKQSQRILQLSSDDFFGEGNKRQRQPERPSLLNSNFNSTCLGPISTAPQPPTLAVPLKAASARNQLDNFFLTLPFKFANPRPSMVL